MTSSHANTSERFPPPSDVAVRALVGEALGLRVSLHVAVPARPGFDEVRGFPHAWRELLRALDRKMTRLGVDPAGDRRRLLGRLEGLDVALGGLDTAPGGLAVFAGRGEPRGFALSTPVETSIHVGRTLRLRPLLEALARECRYRVVALSTNAVALFEGDARALRRVMTADDVPTSLEQALGTHLSAGTLQLHGGAPHDAAAIFHGQGGAPEARNVDKDRFYHVLAGALRHAWPGGDVPVVLVAGRAHAGRFRKVADLPGLLEEGVVANPRACSEGELHRRALGVVQARLARRRDEDLAGAASALAHGRAASGLPAVSAAAVAGRVARVLVRADARLARHVEPSTGALVEAFGDEDALDETCGLVLARGGRVLVHDDGAASGLPDLVGILRE